MKKKIIRNTCIGVSIAGIMFFTSLLYLNYYVDNAKDYKKVLSVQEKKNDFNITQNDNKKDIELSEVILKPEDKNPILEEKADIINLLFLGIDRTDYRDKTMGVYRTDTIIIASIDLNTKKTNVISIPRDTYVFIPAIGKKDKINHAYVWGGMREKGIESTIETVQQFIKYAKIDYYFALDMEPITEIIDDIGGVLIDVEIEMKTNGANLDKGLQILNGEQAFHYVHWRFSGNGDIDRVKRQQKFLKAITEKLNNSDSILDTVNIILKYGKHVQTNLSKAQIIAIAELYKDIDNDQITYYDVPGNGEYIDNISYWIPDEEETDNKLNEVFNK